MDEVERTENDHMGESEIVRRLLVQLSRQVAQHRHAYGRRDLYAGLRPAMRYARARSVEYSRLAVSGRRSHQPYSGCDREEKVQEASSIPSHDRRQYLSKAAAGLILPFGPYDGDLLLDRTVPSGRRAMDDRHRPGGDSYSHLRRLVQNASGTPLPI